jgi:hypothetical protein
MQEQWCHIQDTLGLSSHDDLTLKIRTPCVRPRCGGQLPLMGSMRRACVLCLNRGQQGQPEVAPPNGETNIWTYGGCSTTQHTLQPYSSLSLLLSLGPIAYVATHLCSQKHQFAMSGCVLLRTDSSRGSMNWLQPRRNRHMGRWGLLNNTTLQPHSSLRSLLFCWWPIVYVANHLSGQKQL